MPLLGVPMIGNFGGSGGGGVPAFGARLIQPGAIAGGLVTFSRAQAAGAISTSFAADGVALQEYGANVPRFNGTARRMLFGGQRTNGIRNPRAEGAVVGVIGAGGALPTNWTIVGTTTGLSFNVLGVFVESGISVLRLGVSGTSGATVDFSIRSETTTSVVAAPSQSWAQADFIRLAAGSMTGWTSVRQRIDGRTSGGAVVAPNQFLGSTFTPGATLTRYMNAGTFNSDATLARVQSNIVFNAPNATALDATFDIGLPTLEQASFASTPILPPIGTPGASTRGQDNFTSNFATLFPTGVGTVLASFMLPQSAPSGADQMLFEINDGTANNCIRLRNVAGGNTLLAGRVIGGANVDATTIGSMTPGTLFRVGLTFDGTTLVANFNGGTNQTVAGLPPGLVTLRTGNNAAGTAPTFGETGYFDALPYVIPPANLSAAVAAIP